MTTEAPLDFSVSVNDALELVRTYSWDRHEKDTTCGHTGCEDHPVTTRVIHATRSFGCDWQIDDALDAVRTAKSIRWALNLFRHDLAVEQEDGSVVCFEVPAPQEVRDALIAQMRAAHAQEEARHV